MTTRSWVGVALAVIVFALFGLYLHRDGELNAVAGMIFGGGLLFCGVLIDFPEFLALVKALRGDKSQQYPPLPGSTDPEHPNTEAPQ